MMNERAEENVIYEPLHKNPHALKNGRGKVCFAILFGQLKNLFLEQEYKNTAQKKKKMKEM